MKKKLFLSVVGLILAQNLFAELKVGLSIGPDWNHFDLNKSYTYDYNYSKKTGLSVEIPVQYNFCDWFGLRSGISYVQKGYKLTRTNYKNIYENALDHYFHFPLMTNYSFGSEKFRGFLNLGGYLGFWFAGSREGSSNQFISSTPVYKYSENYEFDERRDNQFDAGFCSSIGILYRLSSYFELSMEGLCYYSLLSTTKNNKANIPKYNTTYSIQFGLSYIF